MRLVGPVDVSAGAGSGKTFTLTERIAHALADPASGVDDIDQILAITFTNKAAAELKGRVRSTLRAQGLFDQARKVDGAWISTIHGMCSRILRANALEIGIDPGFSVMEDSSDVLDQAIEEVLEESRASDYQAYRQLFDAYPVADSPAAFGSDSVTSLLNTLLAKAYELPNGFDDLQLIASREEPGQLARQLLAVYEDSLALMEQIKESATQAQNKLTCEQALDALNDLMESDSSQVYGVLSLCRRLDGRCGSKEQKALIKELNARFDETALRILLCKSALIFDQLVQLARKVDELFAAKKQRLAVLDNSDLIRQALRALENHQVKALYENKFRLVMVDEFQDTDALQLAIVSKLSGAGQRYLCTVGDAQQSIYRFRGADVALYRTYQQEMFSERILAEGGEPCALQLTRNFRSHGDVLAFVKKVCAQQSVFGQDFLDLQAVYDGAGYRARDPRIFMDVTMRHKGKSAEVGSKDDAFGAQAQRIAEYFARMRAAGHDLSQMVLLLGTTTHADLYAQALRQAGFDCVITGGSLFAQSDETQHMALLCRALVNFKDTEALANVLMGPLFQLSSDELLGLTTVWDDKAQKTVTCGLDQGLARCARPAGALGAGGTAAVHADAASGSAAAGDAAATPDAAGALDVPTHADAAGDARAAATHADAGASEPIATPRAAAPSPMAAQAARLLFAARESLRTQPLSRALLRLLWQSGCFARLENQGAQGSACIGNYLKALRLIESIEKEGGVGPVQTAEQYDASISAGLKEAPGALNVHEQQAIRIMTIHASKGLEFPIVAMADFAKTPRSESLLVARFQGKTYATLFPKSEKLGSKTYGKSLQIGLVDEDEEPSVDALISDDSLKAQVLLQRCSLADEAAEGQRLFYVGATRAKEALGLFVSTQEGGDFDAMYPGAYGDVVRALFGDEGVIPLGESFVDYGGSEPAQICCRYYEKPDGEGADATFGADGEDDSAGAASDAATPGDADAVADLDANVRADAAAAPVPSRFLFDLSGETPLNVVAGGFDPRPTGVFSYSSLEGEHVPLTQLEGLWDTAQEEGDSLADALRYFSADDDKATDFGSALHRLCQLSFIESPEKASDQLECIAKTYQVADVQRLTAAFERWLGSAACKRARAAQQCLPEHSFVVPFGNTDQVLEGAFDLLCVEGCGVQENSEQTTGAPKWQRAYVVDYKTGGKAAETPQELHEKHGLQACCYAYALLNCGFDAVDMDFVRVEQADPQGSDTLQTVLFRFDQSDLARIEGIIAAQVEK